MMHEIVTESFSENFDEEYAADDFPLISAMCAKNNYDGCDLLRLVAREGIVATAIVGTTEAGMPAKLCAFETRRDSRRQGYGAELLHHILEHYGTVRANVLRDALEFYEKCSFHVVNDNGGSVVTVEASA